MVNAPALRTCTAEQFLELGMSLRSSLFAGDNWRKRNQGAQIQMFRDAYGTVPFVIAKIWRDLQTTPFADDRINNAMQPMHLLLAYRWMKAYESEAVLRTSFGLVEKTIRKWCKYVVDRIARLRKMKIDPNWEDDDGVMIGNTLDGIHYIIHEPRPFSTEYSSHKEGGNAALVYEYCLSTVRPKLSWLNGPYPAKNPDRNVFRMRLKQAIEKKQFDRSNDFRVIADDGYFALELLDTLSFRNEFDPREIQWFKDRALSRHERFNGMTKTYKVLTTKFRHDRGFNPNKQHPRHQACVEAICVTIQYELDHGISKLFDPYPT